MRIEPCVQLGKRQKTSFAGIDKRNFCEVINSGQRDRNSRALDDLRRLCRVRDLWFLLDVIDFKGDAVRESVASMMVSPQASSPLPSITYAIGRMAFNAWPCWPRVGLQYTSFELILIA